MPEAYNFSSKLLHKIALGNYAIAKMSFSLSQNLVKKRYAPHNIKKVFVSGLARSGTTMLTTYLANIDNFFSLTYQDMPFPLMPNVWRKINTSGKPVKLQERKHGDSIKISYQSVEEIEEYFWKVFSNDTYIAGRRLNFDQIDKNILQKYNDYINAILNCYDPVEEPVYLSKNNNQVLRLRMLHEKLSNAWFIIPFREPLSHARSLLSQHQRFSELQRQDSFILRYMNWLGHHEFGLGHKYFNLGNEKLNAYIELFDPFTTNHWLSVWLNYYTYVADFIGQERILLFNYEKFCEKPAESIQNIGKVIGFHFNETLESFAGKTAGTEEKIDEKLWGQCQDIYDRLRQVCAN